MDKKDFNLYDNGWEDYWESKWQREKELDGLITEDYDFEFIRNQIKKEQ
jgi:hypothetical protein